MITLAVLFLIWFAISYYRISSICKEKSKSFSPFESTYFYFMGYLFGGITSFFLCAFLIIKYLP